MLVVDDNADIRRYIGLILSGAYRVLEAEDGRQGLQAAQTHLPDLIITDVIMPELDGYAFARALKQDPTTESIPVIMVTAKATTEDQVEGLKTGVDVYLTKPFERAILEAQVHNLIALRQRLHARYSQAPILEMSVSPVPRRRSAFEEHAREVIAAHLTDDIFRVEMLAAEVGLSESQLARKLRKEADTTPRKLILTVRAEHAARLLDEGAGNVSEVAYAVGFKSLSHFTRCFREHFHVNPSIYAAPTGGKHRSKSTPAPRRPLATWNRSHSASRHEYARCRQKNAWYRQALPPLNLYAVCGSQHGV